LVFFFGHNLKKKPSDDFQKALIYNLV